MEEDRLPWIVVRDQVQLLSRQLQSAMVGNGRKAAVSGCLFWTLQILLGEVVRSEEKN